MLAGFEDKQRSLSYKLTVYTYILGRLFANMNSYCKTDIAAYNSLFEVRNLEKSKPCHNIIQNS